jgi:nitrogen fixation protein
MERNPAEIIQAAIDAGMDIDAPVMTIEEQDKSGTYVLVLYNGKRLEWTSPQDATAEGDVSPLSKPSARRPAKAGK